ncbi:MAG: TrmB family transcriptional regulator [Nitrososphaerota archaeon]|nr:TrmB family transcriptional regulator [Nitrososphaerota archaeon]
MEIGQKVTEALGRLGLSDYEIKAYSSLLQYGAQTAAEVSRQSSVPYSKVYEVLGRLESKGWVESDVSRPSKYYPKPPDVALQSFRMKRESEYKNYEDTIAKELIPIYEKRDIKERPEVWIVKGEFNIMGKVNEMLADAREELMVALPGDLSALSKAGMDRLADLMSRGINVSVLLSDPSTARDIRSAINGVTVRVRDGMFGGGIVCDAKQVMLLLGQSAAKNPHVAIWADHPGLAMFAKSYFESLWAGAKTVS